MKLKIYVASSWRNSFQPKVVDLLREIGHEVYDFRNPRNRGGFSLSDVDPLWQGWDSDKYRSALNHPVACESFASDFNAMMWADCCVMVLPCGRSANTEAGWMRGAGKAVFVFQPQNEEPELMYKLHNGIFTRFTELTAHFEFVMKSPA